MAYARIAWWSFKSGMRDEAIKRMNGFMNELKSTSGYMGMVSLLSMHNPDRVTVITFWDSEDNMNAIQSDLFQKVVKALSDITTEAPQIANQTVSTMDIPKIYA